MSTKFMSGVEFERRDRREDEREDRSNGDELIPRVSQETIVIFMREFLPEVAAAVEGNVDHFPATYLERIRAVNPIVAEYIAGLAQQVPEGTYSNYVTMAGVLVYRLLEHEFAQRGKEMPIVKRQILDSLKVDIAQEEGYFQKLANSLVTENDELRRVLALYLVPLGWLPNGELPLNQAVSSVLESGLGVYALIKAQAKADRSSGL
jgi:hypothetical protein